MYRSKYQQLVELQILAGVTGNNNNVYFQQQPQLQSFNLPGQHVYIKAIETFSNAALTTSPITTAYPVAAPADLQNAVLTLVTQTQELNKQIPLTRINYTYPSSGSFVAPQQEFLVFKDMYMVDWTKCYVTLPLAPISTPPFSYLFLVHYDYEPDAY